jgi:NAD(P)H-dependent flavin oxidoreductase YrpB (nitropropane dioxygenase family)
MGSYWLTTSEYTLGAGDTMKQALVAAGSDQTVRARVYSGKPARLLKSRWTDAWAEPGAPEPLPMPLQNLLVSEAHQRIMNAGDPTVVAMPVGQIVGRMNAVRPVAELVTELVSEFDEALTRLDKTR